MTIQEAIDNAVEFLETTPDTSGEIADDLRLAASRIRTKHPAAGRDEL